MNTPLTEQEENLIKDILKEAGDDIALTEQLAKACGLSKHEFELIADSIFRKLGNGRVTLVADEMPEEDSVRHLGDEHPENWEPLDRESAAPDERAASDRNERYYGGSVD